MKKTIILMILLSGLGCSGLFKWLIEKPEVSLDSVKVESLSFSGATLRFGIKVTNPNRYALTLNSLVYDLELGDKPISKGNISQAEEIPARGTKVVWVPVPVMFADIISSASDLFKGGSQTYRIRGSAKVSSIPIPFDYKGDLKIRE